MIENNWGRVHQKIFNELICELNKENIKYFILRNYKELPENNISKDVDIIVEPKSLNKSIRILKNIYKNNDISHYYEINYFYVYCCHAMDIEKKFSIHIDLIGSFISKGYEIFDFNEMYEYAIPYKNFFVLNEYFEGVMVFIYKQFNYKPKLNNEYKEIIFNTHRKYTEFQSLLNELLGQELSHKIINCIERKDFDNMIEYSPNLTKKLKNYTLKKKPLRTINLSLKFILEKVNRYIFSYKKYSKFFSVMAPDGAGKTTFLDNLAEQLVYYFLNSNVEERMSIYHFRPTILPNLGAVGEKAKVMKQDTDYANPHRAKPASTISSLVRITYYWLDYNIGTRILLRKDVKFDRFTIFDRYIYDFIVDPFRSRINLPTWVRKLYVKLAPQPKIVFYLHADPDVIFKRKQELTLEEIKRQNKIYLDLANSHDRFKILDANRHYDESVDEALEIILDTFCEKL